MQRLIVSKQAVNLMIQNTTLYFRQTIPKDLRPYFRQTAIKKSLKTGNISQGKRKAVSMTLLMWDIFTALREGDTKLSNLPPAKLREIVNHWLVWILEKDEMQRCQGLSNWGKAFWGGEEHPETGEVNKGYAQAVISEIDEAMKTNDFTPSHYDINTGESGGVFELRNHVRGIIKTLELDILEPSPDYIALAREVAQAYKFFLQAGQLRTLGQYHEAEQLINERIPGYMGGGMTFNQATQPPLASQTLEDDPALGTSITVSDFADLYMESHVQHLSAKDRPGIRKDLSLFSQYVGKDTPLHKVSLDKVRTFSELMYQMPVNAEKMKKLKGKNIEQLAKAKREEGKTISPRTAHSRLTRLCTALRWAKKRAYRFHDNLISSLVSDPPKEKVHVSQKRDAFVKDDIVKIFRHPGYTEDNFNNPFQFWLILLALYTGARQNELCQLNPQRDIRQTDKGVWYIDINQDDGKSVKTQAGVRKVPIHPMLISIGFLDFVERQRQAGHDLLFPELRNNQADKNLAAKMSKWFNRTFKQSIGIEAVRTKTSTSQEKKDFHSFRHHFASYCKSHDIQTEKLQECIGHEIQTGITKIYSGIYGPDKLYEDVIQHLNFDEDYGLDLQRLQSSKYAKGKNTQETPQDGIRRQE